MKLEFKLPDLGENIDGGDVIGVLVAIGDQLSEDQPVIELETDKAVIEVPSSVAGKVVDIHVNQGDHTLVGSSILTVEAESEDEQKVEETAPMETPVENKSVSRQETAPAPEPPVKTSLLSTAGKSVEFCLPDLGENIESGEVIGLLVKPGDTVTEDQPLIELETDKAVIEVPSSVTGTVQEMHVTVGEQVMIGQLVATIEGSAPSPAMKSTRTSIATSSSQEVVSVSHTEETTSSPPRQPLAAPLASTAKLVPAAPSVRRLAREIGVDMSEVSGSGPGGRISQNDVKDHARMLNNKSATAVPAASTETPLPDFSQWGKIAREPMSNVRRTTAARLSQAWSTIPHVTQFDKADVTELEKARKGFSKRVEAAGGKLTPAAIVLKVVASALKVFPQFSASIDMANQEVIYKRYCHIGVAVDSDRGLLVPVVRNVDQKNLIELAVELGEIAAKARSKKLRPDDMQGGCFTVSNLGSIGGTGFAPIVNPPEVAILGVARSAQEPVFVDDIFQPRLMMPLSLSYDHRLIDGADGARFLRWVAEALENPLLILLEG